MTSSFLGVATLIQFHLLDLFVAYNFGELYTKIVVSNLLKHQIKSLVLETCLINLKWSIAVPFVVFHLPWSISKFCALFIYFFSIVCLLLYSLQPLLNTELVMRFNKLIHWYSLLCSNWMVPWLGFIEYRVRYLWTILAIYRSVNNTCWLPFLQNWWHWPLSTSSRN